MHAVDLDREPADRLCDGCRALPRDEREALQSSTMVRMLREYTARLLWRTRRRPRKP
jgi:hypothetical protein